LIKTIEDVKEFWNKRPCNIRHSNKEIGSKEYFDEIEHRKYFVEPHIKEFADFDKWKDKKVLEIGCGIGTDTINFARAGAKISAVELSEVSLNLAKERAKVFNLDINFYLGSAEELSEIVPLETYDLIYSFGVIHHSPNPQKILDEIQKYMDEKTLLKIMVYNKNSWKVFWILAKYGHFAFWKIDELISKYSEAQTGCPITYSYTKKTAKDLFKNFEIKNISAEHIFPYVIKDYVNYKYNKVWYFKYIPEKLFKKIENLLGWHLCIDAILKK